MRLSFLDFIRHKEPDNSDIKDDLEYGDLAPIDSIPDDSEYFKALDWALKNDSIKNIAISGPYGSGKSSIISTYLKNNRDIKDESINISIASFEKDNDSKEESTEKDNTSKDESTVKDGTINNKSTKEISMSMIEKSVLKQLFYKIDYDKIPQSRYRKLHRIKSKKIHEYFLIIIILSVLLTFVFSPDMIKSLFSKIEDAGNNFGLPAILSKLIFGIMCAISYCLVSKLIIKILSNAQIKEISLPVNAKIENKEEPDSIFNKNLDEIMYFFEATKYKYVFFEDLDRFNSIEIFEKLRELNTLLNNYDNIKEDRQIIFIYAVRDDVFKNENRTKFFDFIIPVIPVMNSTNAADVLIDKLKLKDGSKGYDISLNYVFDVAPFIEDMRILQNICNEFIIYKKTLRDRQALNLKDEEMLSIIMFKNIYPKDFSDLQAEKGIVKEAFDELKYKKNEYSQELKENIEQDTRLLDEIKKELLSELREIKISMLYALIGWEGEITNIIISDDQSRTKYFISDILDDSFNIYQFENNSNIVIYYRLKNGNTSSAYVNKQVANIYINRWKRLYTNEKLAIIRRLEENKTKLREINGYSLQKMIDEYGAGKVLPDKAFANKMLTFLLWRGFINEKYANYINYFKGVSLTRDDMNFILSIKNNEPEDYDYHLSEISIIIERLQEFEFGTKATYNYELLDYLLSHRCCAAKLKAYISRLICDEGNWDFIDSFINQSDNKGCFVKYLSNMWPDFWENIFNNSSIDDKNRMFYLRLIMINADIEDIKEQDSGGAISDFIINSRKSIQQLLDNNQLKYDKLKLVIEALDIKFKYLSIDNIEAKMIDYIFDNNYYLINYDMIHEIVKYKNDMLLYDLTRKNYSTIRKLNYPPLLDYVNANLNEYMNSVFFRDGNIDEDVDSIIILINNMNGNTDVAISIIKQEKFRIDNISDFCGSLPDEQNDYVQLLWNQLLIEDKVYSEWKNVNTYYNRFGLTSELKKYITSKYDELITSAIIIKFEENRISDNLFEDIIQSDIDDVAFEEIVNSIQEREVTTPYSSIPKNKIKILILNNFLSFTPSNYSNLCNVYPELDFEFILMNQSDYIDYMNEIHMESEMLLKLLTDTRIKPELIKLLIDKYATDYMTDDLAHIIKNKKYSINNDVFKNTWKYLNDEEKNELFLQHFDLLDCNELENYFKELSDYYPGFSYRSKVHNAKIEATDETERLANHLVKIGYITSYKIEDIKTNKGQRLINNQNFSKVLSCRIKSVQQSSRTTICAN